MEQKNAQAGQYLLGKLRAYYGDSVGFLYDRTPFDKTRCDQRIQELRDEIAEVEAKTDAEFEQAQIAWADKHIADETARKQRNQAEKERLLEIQAQLKEWQPDFSGLDAEYAEKAQKGFYGYVGRDLEAEIRDLTVKIPQREDLIESRVNWIKMLYGQLDGLIGYKERCPFEHEQSLKARECLRASLEAFAPGMLDKEKP